MTAPDARIAAALAIHVPCHTAYAEAFGCVHGHYAEDGQWLSVGAEPAVCLSCTYDDRTVTYLCPTAEALGVAEEVTA